MRGQNGSSWRDLGSLTAATARREPTDAAWLVGALLAVGTVLALTPRTGLAPCWNGTCLVSPNWTRHPLSAVRTMIGLDPEVYRALGISGTVLGALLTLAAIALTAPALRRRRRILDVVVVPLLALLPTLSVIPFGAYAVSSVIGLALVAALVALRDPLRALPALGATLLAVVAVVPIALAIGPTRRLGVPGAAVLPTALLLTVALFAIAAGLGAWLRARAGSELASAATTEARRAQTVAVAVETRSAERARLARDLHDVVAHHISLVAVRAEAAPYTVPDLSDSAKAVLAEIADDARSALGELRQVLTVLQRAEELELAPQPGADDVAGLVETARSAGQDVSLDGEWSGIPAGPGYVLYRAAQEALTNARRHAPGEPVQLELLRGGALVGLVARNRTTEGESIGADGRGLVGMRERVEALGGLVTTTAADGVFEVRLTLPLGEEER